MPLSQALAQAAGQLRAAGIEAPRREARLLAAHLLGAKPGALLDEAAVIDPVAYAALVDRRAQHEPFAHITGSAGFWRLDLAVSADSLVPRADSEALIEAALRAFPDAAQLRHVLDLGTGTGCLLLAALQEFPAAYGVGVDVAPAAAKLAARNAAANGLAARAAFVVADWAAPLQGRFDLVLCNPPYIPRADLAGLMPEVRLYEPARALDGGPGGLDCYQAVLSALPGLLAPGGVAILELGIGQATEVAALAQGCGLVQLRLTPDVAGIDRAITLAAQEP